MPGGKMSVGGRRGVVGVMLCVLILLYTPTPTLASTPTVESMNAVLREVTGQLEMFNSLYINKLERELSSSSARIAALEATVRSVADRAAAWDNIQNHMTVWTDQTRTMERKLDMLNRCHEKQESWESRLSAVDALNHKLIALDKKINAMTRLEFKVEQVSERVEEVDSTVNWVKKHLNSPQSPIIAEFAGRGILSSLVNIESKLDNLTHGMTTQNGASQGSTTTYKRNRVSGWRSRHSRPQIEPEPGIPFTQGHNGFWGPCQLHPRDSRRLQDVSAKVDVVFDRLTDPDYDYDYLASRSSRRARRSNTGQLRQRSVPLTVPAPSADVDDEGFGEDEPSPEHLFARFWKSVFTPFKKIKRQFRGFENQLAAVHRSCNDTGSLEGLVAAMGGAVQSSIAPLDRSLRQEREDTRSTLTDQAAAIHKVSQAVSNSAYVSEQVLAEVTSQFQRLQAVVRDGFDQTRTIIYQYCSQDASHLDPYHPREPPAPAPPRTPEYTPPTPRTPQYVPPTPTYTKAEDSVRGGQAGLMEPKVHTLHGDRRPHTHYTYRVYGSTRRHKDQRAPHSLKQGGRRRWWAGRRDRTQGGGQPRRAALHRSWPKWGSRSARSTSQGLYNLTLSPTGQGGDTLGCEDLAAQGTSRSGVYPFTTDSSSTSPGHSYHTRYCDLEGDDGEGWTVVQRRGMLGTPHFNFTQDWNTYKSGFGELSREFWWGNDNIHRMTRERKMMIRFDLWDFDGNYAYAEYLTFSIGEERDNYRLNVFGYRGNASDSFSAHNGYLFSTYDVDNDEAPECCPCAPAYGGGWWFYGCFESNLNGEYYSDPQDNDYYRGLIWELWLGDYSLKATQIKIRAASTSPGEDADHPSPLPTLDPYPTPLPDYPELPLRQP